MPKIVTDHCVNLYGKPTEQLISRCKKGFRRRAGSKKLFKRLRFISSQCFEPFDEPVPDPSVSSESEENDDGDTKNISLPETLTGMINKCIKCMTCLEIGNCEFITPTNGPE